MPYSSPFLLFLLLSSTPPPPSLFHLSFHFLFALLFMSFIFLLLPLVHLLSISSSLPLFLVDRLLLYPRLLSRSSGRYGDGLKVVAKDIDAASNVLDSKIKHQVPLSSSPSPSPSAFSSPSLLFLMSWSFSLSFLLLFLSPLFSFLLSL